MTYPFRNHYRCPQCRSRDIRIGAELSVSFRPNDPDTPFDDDVFCAMDAYWSPDADARCATCSWEGLESDFWTEQTGDGNSADATLSCNFESTEQAVP